MTQLVKFPFVELMAVASMVGFGVRGFHWFLLLLVAFWCGGGYGLLPRAEGVQR